MEINKEHGKPAIFPIISRGRSHLPYPSYADGLVQLLFVIFRKMNKLWDGQGSFIYQDSKVPLLVYNQPMRRKPRRGVITSDCSG